MRKKSTIVLYELMFNYCIYQLSLRTKFKDPRRCDRYNILLNMITNIYEIREDNEIYQDILFDYYEYQEDNAKYIATRIMQIIGDGLDIGVWECRNDGKSEYLYDELYDEIVSKINIKEILSDEYIDKLKRLKAAEEMEAAKLEDKYSDIKYGGLNNDTK